MRTLLAKAYNEKPFVKWEEDDEKIIRVFGTSKSVKSGHPVNSRILFSDVIMENMEEIIVRGVESPTEAKEENAIRRVTGIANPRVIERVIKGATFPLNIIYNVDNEEELVEDFHTIADGLKLLQYDYIGGHGSRGYGRISISNLQLDVVVGDVKEELLSQCEAIVGNLDMEYCIYKFNFKTAVHIGSGKLSDGEMTFHADTLFSALCQEALQIGGEDMLQELISYVEKDQLRISDCFPFIRKKSLLYSKTDESCIA